jgi:hypothetical protein
MFVSATGDHHSPFEVLVYVAAKEEDVPLPNAEYKRLIVHGARHWKIPELYCLMLEQIQTVPD